MEQIREYCGDSYREYAEERDRDAKEREDEKERERMERDARVHEYLHGYEGGCPLGGKKIEVLR